LAPVGSTTQSRLSRSRAIGRKSSRRRPVSALPPAHTQVPRTPLGVPHGFGTTAFPTPRVINCDQSRQAEGRDVSMRKTGNPRPVLICPRVVTASPLLVRAGNAGLSEIYSARRSSQTPPLVPRFALILRKGHPLANNLPTLSRGLPCSRLRPMIYCCHCRRRDDSITIQKHAARLNIALKIAISVA
jgi:hypothetical protein